MKYKRDQKGKKKDFEKVMVAARVLKEMPLYASRVTTMLRPCRILCWGLRPLLDFVIQNAAKN